MGHFRTYLWGAPFTLRTDHRPLVGLLTTKGSARATPRIENWYTRMLDYQYTVEYVPGNSNQLADCMSRLPLRDTRAPECKEMVCEVGWVETEWDNSHAACTRGEWVEECSRDEVVCKVKEWCEKGWPRAATMVPEEVRPYWAVRDELSVVRGLLCRQERLVAPRSMRKKVLRVAHQGHKGASALKRTVRECYWWERMDREMEEFVRECEQCKLADKSKVVVRSELMPIEAPKDVWDTVGMDIIGPIQALGEGVIYAITLIDYTSKWPEVQFVTKIDTATVIAFLRAIFAREGCPRHLLTDNGVQFISEDMKTFLKEMGVVHKTTSLYHPQSNGLVERFNRTVKENLQLSIRSKTSWKANIQSLLWAVRTAPNKITTYSPFQLMRGRKEWGPLKPGWVQPSNKVQIKWAELEEAHRASKEVYKQRYDRKRCSGRKVRWSVGDNAWIRAPGLVRKGESKFMGPYRVIEVGEKHVQMDDGRKWSVDRLARGRAEPREEEEQVMDWEETEEESREVETEGGLGESREERSEAGACSGPTRELGSRARRPPLRFMDYEMG